MRIFSKFSFRAKIGLGTLVIVVMASLVSGLPSIRMASQALTQESKKRGQVLAHSISLRAVEPILSLDFLRLKNMVDEIRDVDPDVDYAFILDVHGQVLAHTFQDGFPVELRKVNQGNIRTGTTRILLLDVGDESIYDFATPVMVGDAPVGMVRVGLSRTKIQEQVNRFLLAMSGLAGAALMLAILAAMLFADRVTRRINLLRRYAENLVTGDLEPDKVTFKHGHCWDINNCTLKECPAYGDTQRRCWYLAGTMCPDCGDDKYPDKLQSCRNCAVYHRNRGDEIEDLADTFDVMAMSLKNHINELQKADKEIRQQERLMRTVLDVTPDLVSLQDKDMVYQAVNKGFADFVGLRVEEVPGRTDADVFSDSGGVLLSDEVQTVLETGQARQREIRVNCPAGKRWFHVVLIPVEDQERQVAGVLRTARDISAIKQVQAQLVQAQKMESLGKLAGGVAHEINTPLGIIMGYAQLLQEDVEEGSQIRSDLQIIEKQGRVCRKIVADLLGFSRQTESAKREMCFNNSLMEAISLVRHTFEMDKVEILTQLDDRMPIIFGDPEKLKQVWINLLNNARDAIGTNGFIMVVSALNYSGRNVSVMVADTGSGISRENIKRIFDPFFTTKGVGMGTGLGLSVSFGIIEDHQGTIKVESPVPTGFFNERAQAGGGPGTLFIVDLPLDHGTDDG